MFFEYLLIILNLDIFWSTTIIINSQQFRIELISFLVIYLLSETLLIDWCSSINMLVPILILTIFIISIILSNIIIILMNISIRQLLRKLLLLLFWIWSMR